MSIIETDSGYVVVDPLVSTETAQAGMELVYQHVGRKPIFAVIYTHSHVDHWAGVKGVIDEADVEAGKIKVIAPEHFLESAISENIIVGNVMSRRASYMYGNLLPKDPTGQVGAGLGPTTSSGTVTLIDPTDDITHTGQTITIDGLEIEFQMTPGTEAPAEMNFLFPRYRALCMAENCSHTLHNLYTLRGAQVRDAKAWAHYIDEAIEYFAGGSMSGSALMVQSGQRTRWANVFAGILVAGLVLAFGNLIELIPQTALAALLIVVGAQLLKISNMLTVARTGQIPMTAMLITFVATLFLPLQYAVFIGVAVSILLAAFHMANKVNLVEMTLTPGGYLEEAPAPRELPSHKATVFYIYGSTYFAAASTLETLLPSVENTQHAVAILSLRGSAEVGSTFLAVIQRFAETLRSHDCELMLAGVDDQLYDQLKRTNLLDRLGPDRVFRAQPRVGAAVEEALEAASAWMAEQSAPAGVGAPTHRNR